ncbi:MAG: tRNA (guanosine(37)-N1)-methyltransferase TrmD [Bacteroidetes bacterium RIFCSPLOWO2_02_FULL_36_8]|nr:MAG: tRNA (guanosine(37)-N1)-methyltransferase TrmD [Bacteroidetes bacterium RIFCSPLOWO2_02_FULL_36_8]OFY71706.1 MAG: tRNA (guanosine(37)-N1)-methyltransferase TrmD [Bacteroidetes bacterium RIFCSPLOWO2_12_FULL_37_12]
MRIDIITSLPGLLSGPFDHSIIKRAKDKGLVEILIHDLRKFSTDKHKKLDDYPYGGGPGMVMMIEPIALCIEHLKSERNYDEIIFLSPDGELLNQKLINRFSLLTNIILLCGHYRGIDERVREHFITKEISIGNYVLSGGEIPAAVLTDAIVRLLPGAISDETSALNDSFQGDLLDVPLYTRPAEFRGLKVPKVLLSGDHKKIDAWHLERALERTKKRRPERKG